MTKRELIDEIITINHSASPRFLARFENQELDDYLSHLRVLATPRLSGHPERYEKYFRNCPTIQATRPQWRTDTEHAEDLVADEFDARDEAEPYDEAEAYDEAAAYGETETDWDEAEFDEQPVGPDEREQLFAEALIAAEDDEEDAPEGAPAGDHAELAAEPAGVEPGDRSPLELLDLFDGGPKDAEETADAAAEDVDDAPAPAARPKAVKPKKPAAAKAAKPKKPATTAAAGTRQTAPLFAGEQEDSESWLY